MSSKTQLFIASLVSTLSIIFVLCYLISSNTKWYQVRLPNDEIIYIDIADDSEFAINKVETEMPSIYVKDTDSIIVLDKLVGDGNGELSDFEWITVLDKLHYAKR